MKISNVQLYSFNARYKGKYLKPKNTQQSEKSFSFPFVKPYSIELQAEKEDEFFKSFLEKNGKVTKEEYQKILKKHPKTIYKAQNRCNEISKKLDCSPQINGKIAYELKKYFDSCYGNYTILSVGTSPAPITEVMQNLGAKVIFLPITGLRDINQNSHYFNRVNYPTLASKYENLGLAMDYCTYKGISKKDAGKILILDLCATGKSAGIIKQMLLERNDIAEENIIIQDMTKTLEDMAKNHGSNLSTYEINCFDADMRMSKCSKICNVPHFDYYGSKNKSSNYITRKPHETKLSVFRRFEDFSKPDARAWALCSTHEAFKLLKNNIS